MPTDDLQRSVLPHPGPGLHRHGHVRRHGSDTTFPPIDPLRPPDGAPNVLIILLDDVGFGASSAFGGPSATPTFERLADGRPKLHPVPHDGAVLTDAGGAAVGPQPPHVGMGGITEIATAAPGYNSLRPNTCAPLARDAQAQRLHAPRSSASATRCRSGRRARSGPFDRWPHPAAGSSTSTASSAARPTSGTRPLRGHDAGRAAEDARGGLPLHGRHDRQGDRLDAASRSRWLPDKPFFIVLRARRDARPAPRADGLDRTSTRASSTRAGTRSARRRSRGRRSWA